jgi:hypothetical protein
VNKSVDKKLGDKSQVDTSDPLTGCVFEKHRHRCWKTARLGGAPCRVDSTEKEGYI